MGGLDGPSFSLGFDFDVDHTISRYPQLELTCHSPDDYIQELSSQATGVSFCKDSLKDKLIKFYPIRVSPTSLEKEATIQQSNNIYEICTKTYKPSSAHPYSGCSTSKLSVHAHRVLTTQSTGEYKMTQKEQTMNIPASTSTQANSNRFKFPKKTGSPFRKFQLLDSDSQSDSDSDSNSDSDSDSDFDESRVNKYANLKARETKSSSKAKLHDPVENPTMSGHKRANASDNVCQGHDLWDDFYTEKRSSIPTPTFDEVCKEYFKSMNNNRTAPLSTNAGNCSREIKDRVQIRINIDNDGVQCKLGDPVTPAHHYFYHDDPRVRNLVSIRLPNFFPLDAANARNQQSVPSAIDYMSQFNHGANSTPQGSHMTNPGTSSKRVKKISRKSNIEALQEGSGGWVNPRNSVSIPTDAGKRRVHAVGGQSAGHWFTSPEGKKVYVSKTGQEFTGRVAYTHYKKDNGKGFKRSGGKKKGAGKKKTFGK